MIEYPYIMQPSHTIKDEKIKVKYVAAFLLGDGSVSYANSTNAGFEASNIVKNEDYILWRADILSNITRVRLSHIHNTKDGVQRQPQIRTSTSLHPFFTTFRKRLYIENHKVIDPHYLKLFDLESLAILYMDDGNITHENIRKDGTRYQRIFIATHGYSYPEVDTLRIAIKDKTGFHFDIKSVWVNDTIRYKLGLNTNEVSRFCKELRPYMKPSFEYKISIG